MSRVYRKKDRIGAAARRKVISTKRSPNAAFLRQGSASACGAKMGQSAAVLEKVLLRGVFKKDRTPARAVPAAEGSLQHCAHTGANGIGAGGNVIYEAALRYDAAAEDPFRRQGIEEQWIQECGVQSGMREEIERFIPVICVRCDEKLLRAEGKQIADVGDMRIQRVKMPRKKALNRNVSAKGDRRRRHIVLKQMAGDARGAADLQQLCEICFRRTRQEYAADWMAMQIFYRFERRKVIGMFVRKENVIRGAVWRSGLQEPFPHRAVGAQERCGRVAEKAVYQDPDAVIAKKYACVCDQLYADI